MHFHQFWVNITNRIHFCCTANYCIQNYYFIQKLLKTTPTHVTPIWKVPAYQCHVQFVRNIPKYLPVIYVLWYFLYFIVQFEINQIKYSIKTQSIWENIGKLWVNFSQDVIYIFYRNILRLFTIFSSLHSKTLSNKLSIIRWSIL